MSRPSITSTLASLLAIAALAALSAGAFAYWSATSTTTATTVLPDTQPITFSLGVPTAELYPGHDASVAIVAHNSNSHFVHIGAMALHTGPDPFAVDGAHSGCDVSVLSFTTQDNGGEGWNVPPLVGSTDGTLSLDMPSAIAMDAAAADACQGATFTVRLLAVD